MNLDIEWVEGIHPCHDCDSMNTHGVIARLNSKVIVDKLTYCLDCDELDFSMQCRATELDEKIVYIKALKELGVAVINHL